MSQHRRPPCPKCGRKMFGGCKTPKGKTRWRCFGGGRGTRGEYCFSSTAPESIKREAVEFREDIGKCQRYIITSAQNATPVHKKFFAALKTAARVLDAELVVIPIRYRNPTSRWEGSARGEEWWSQSVQPYLFAGRKKLNPNLILLADIKTQPTAESPLTGFEAITHGESGILGHSKLQLRSIPTPQNKLPKLLTTTGSCTVPNYTDTKAGKKGEFHHSLAAVIVEIDGRKFHLRQLNAHNRSGQFTDLDVVYTPKGTRKAPPPLALIMGDTHVDFIDRNVYRGTFGAKGIVPALRPRHLVWHDLCDMYSRNPHHRGNVLSEIAKLQTGANKVREEVRRACEFVRKHTPDFSRSVIVPSNHVDFLTRWIRDTDWRSDPENADFYLETALALVRSTRLGPVGLQHADPFAYWAKQILAPARTVYLRRDQSFSLGGIELGFHGDAGPNGARGSIKNMRRIGTRTVIGHSHTPGIEEGCYQTGTSTSLRLEYTVGPSSWLNTHCVIYASGKRSLINIIDGEWRICQTQSRAIQKTRSARRSLRSDWFRTRSKPKLRSRSLKVRSSTVGTTGGSPASVPASITMPSNATSRNGGTAKTPTQRRA
jgi:hypothetical protein